MCCISFDSYIKPQLRVIHTKELERCISFDSYIKPQLHAIRVDKCLVVYLLIPTSNHNCQSILVISPKVVYLLIPTSNHNLRYKRFRCYRLYIFWFLHQTTTQNHYYYTLICCISFDSYIKPQRLPLSKSIKRVVYLLIPTSNHNYCLDYDADVEVVYLLIPTSNHN